MSEVLRVGVRKERYKGKGKGKGKEKG